VRQDVAGDVAAGLVHVLVGVAALEAGHERVRRPRHERLGVRVRQRELAEGDLLTRLRRRGSPLLKLHAVHQHLELE